MTREMYKVVKYFDTYPEKIIESNVELAVQINGKVRFKITVPTSFSEEEIKEQVKNDDKLTQYIDGKQIQKIIVIKSRIVNIVVK